MVEESAKKSYRIALVMIPRTPRDAQTLRVIQNCVCARDARRFSIYARIYTHCATRRPLTARHKNNFETALADIRASEKAKKKNKGKERPADTLVKFSACGSRGSYNRERATQRGTPALFIHALNLANVLHD